MTKADLVEKVATQVNLTKKDTEVVIDTIFDSIAQALAAKSEGKVELRGFGSFRIRKRGSRLGRNPKTGAGAKISARLVVSFKPSNIMRARINGEE